MKNETAYKKALAMAAAVLRDDIEEAALWDFCYVNGVSMCELWRDDDIVGFMIEDDPFYYKDYEED